MSRFGPAPRAESGAHFGTMRPDGGAGRAAIAPTPHALAPMGAGYCFLITLSATTPVGPDSSTTAALGSAVTAVLPWT